MFNISKYKEIRQILEKDHKNCEIVSISKNHPKESVLEAIGCGVRIFGENRVNEAKNKFLELKEIYPNIQLHLTGPLQSNKVKLATSLFDVFHTLDREKIATEFSKQSENLKNKKIFVQVNTGDEVSKSGFKIIEIKSFIEHCQNDLRLNISGLMCIPPIDDDPNKHFEILRGLANDNNLKELSIGMSNDYKIALKYNPKYIRLGTVLFGSR